jgi:hypothetical protein
MGYNARNDESATTSRGCSASEKRNAARWRPVRRFNSTLSAKGYVWFWPKITASLTSKHHWLVIVCDSCETVVDLDSRVLKRREAGPFSGNAKHERYSVLLGR